MNIFKVFKRNKDIVKLAVPVFLELILSVAMGYINQFMLAGIPIASNAVSQANQISNIFIVSFSVFSTSSLILITQLKGSGNNELLNKVYSLSFWVNFILGVVVSSLVIGLANPLFTMMQVKDNVFPYAVMYQYVSGASIIFLALNQVLSSFLRANKKMTQPMLIAVITNVVDAIGVAITLWALTVGVSALLCIVFKLGIYGAFIGACLDECVRGIIFEIRWKLGKWKNKTLVKNI